MGFVAILAGLAPAVLLVALGGAVRGRLPQAVWAGLDRLNFELLFPALIFTAAAARPIDLSRVAVIGPSVWAILTLGLVAGYAARRFGPESFLDFAGAWQTAWRFNTALGFVAVAAVPAADAALMAVAAGLAVPLANVFAVSALSRGGDLGFGRTLARVATNPFLVASVLGVAVGVSGLALPGWLMAPLSLLAQAAVPLALLSIGATMDWRALARLTPFGAVLSAVKLVVLPAATLALCILLRADPAVMAVLVLFAALPTATGSLALTAAFGADRVLVATIIAQNTAMALVTLPLWLLALDWALFAAA